MTDDNKQPMLLPGLISPSDDSDYLTINNIIKQRGLSATLDIIGEYCQRRIAYAVQTKNQANKFAWSERYNAIRFAVLTIDKHKKL